MPKIKRSFYQQSAKIIAKKLLGKYLVFNSAKGKVSGKIIDVEAYPAFYDDVSHGNKKTKRTKILYNKGGYAYIYVIYGIHHQFGVVVNKKDIPEVVFIRALIPEEGTGIMKRNFGKPITQITDLTKSPGNLCKSFGIDTKLYGVDLTQNIIFVEDRGDFVNPGFVKAITRIGINPKLKGSKNKLRFLLMDNLVKL
ncbi:MAG: hypothetical protein A3D63_03610 [Candidatus Wildermuthbacteria bacterium RIFCSPHIGHO2_02_FULL_49_17]|nr:MAG: hypothetical protein A3D63_03610 [Candidatus Wildermuthbacteria bacterium RIFCSPHIGHO2_02_FULL_49_17]